MRGSILSHGARAPANSRRVRGIGHRRPVYLPGCFEEKRDSVGWDDGADRASNDADVSIVPPKIPYGGFSPVRLQGWLVGRCLPARRRRLTPRGLLPPFVHPVAGHALPPCVGTWARWCTAIRARKVSLYPRGPRSGPGCSVPVHHHLIGPMRPARRHIATSPHGGLYAMPSLCVPA